MDNILNLIPRIHKKLVREIESNHIKETYIFHDCHRCGAFGGVQQDIIEEADLLEKECQYCKKMIAIW